MFFHSLFCLQDCRGKAYLFCTKFCIHNVYLVYHLQNSFHLHEWDYYKVLMGFLKTCWLHQCYQGSISYFYGLLSHFRFLICLLLHFKISWQIFVNGYIFPFPFSLPFYLIGFRSFYKNCKVHTDEHYLQCL